MEILKTPLLEKKREVKETISVGERFSVSATVGKQVFPFTDIDTSRDYKICGLTITPSAFTDGDKITIRDGKGNPIIKNVYMDGSSIEITIDEDDRRPIIEKNETPTLEYHNVSAQAKIVYVEIIRGYMD